MQFQPHTVSVSLCPLFFLLSTASADKADKGTYKYEYEDTIVTTKAYGAIKLTVGAIVGVVIVVLVAKVILIVACCWWCCKRRNARPTTVVVQQPMQPMQGTPQVNLFQAVATYPGPQAYPQQQVASNPPSEHPPPYLGAKY